MSIERGAKMEEPLRGNLEGGIPEGKSLEEFVGENPERGGQDGRAKKGED